MRVVNKHTEPYTVYIGRPTIFGNPFVIGIDGDRSMVVFKYEGWVRNQPKVLDAISKLKNDDVLGCFCHPKPCHGDVIIKLYRELHSKKEVA